MGQQQLLLLVLSAIIVGIAIVVGMNMFGTGAYQSNRDAVIQDAVTIAAKAQEWYRKPSQLGGGNGAFDGLTLTTIGFPANTANGAYSILSASGNSLQIQGVGVEDGNGDGTDFTVRIVVSPDQVDSTIVVNE